MMPADYAQTITDIFRQIKISKSTVSWALSDNPLIAIETKEPIRAFTSEYNDCMNTVARRLRMVRRHAITLVMSKFYTDFSGTNFI
jgi:DNA-binding LacI/PurR family transcriptional regulator